MRTTTVPWFTCPAAAEADQRELGADLRVAVEDGFNLAQLGVGVVDAGAQRRAQRHQEAPLVLRPARRPCRR
jgi:hypothetical protein